MPPEDAPNSGSATDEAVVAMRWIRRFWWGFCLPFHVLRQALEDPQARSRWIRTALFQAIGVVVIGSVIAIGLAGAAHLYRGLGLLADGRLTDGIVEIAQGEWWKLGTLIGTCFWVAQTGFLAFTHDFHDGVSTVMSRVIGIPPEDASETPRIHFDVPWLRRKLRRRIRGFLVVASGTASLSPIILVLMFFGIDRSAQIVAGVVGAYWWVVFSASRSSRAWRDEANRTPPTPIQKLIDATEESRWLNWGLPRMFVRIGERFSSSMYAPARAIESDPPAFIGLALARIVTSPPVIRLLTRSAMGVAISDQMMRGDNGRRTLPAGGLPMSEARAESVGGGF